MSNRLIRLGLPVLAGVLSALLCPVHIPGQVLYGSMVDNVPDQSNAPVPNGNLRETPTNDVGAYSFLTVSNGTFNISVSKPRFQTTTKSDAVVTINSVAHGKRPSAETEGIGGTGLRAIQKARATIANRI